MHRTLIALATLLLIAAVAIGKPSHEIKFASLAPEGSSWMNQMRALDTELREATGGEVGFKLYAGGVQGDEPDVLRKMRFNQLHAAGFTGNGMGEILPATRLLEVPFLFRSKDEVDHILAEFTEEFDAAFREKGYVLLGWTEVGYVYFFSNSPIHTLDDLENLKVWTWQGDPLAAALFHAMGVSPVPLSVPEVMTALQTGMIDAVYTSPMAAISLGWFSRVKYVNTQPLTNSMGAVLMSKRVFDRLSPEEQETLLTLSRRHMSELTEQTRRDNADGLRELERAGITLLPPPDEDVLESYQDLGRDVRERLAGDLYDRELLESVLQSLAEFRATRDPAATN